MRRSIVVFFAISLSLPAPSQNPPASTPTRSPANSAGLYVYPKNHQSSEMQLKDETECYASAKQASGVDPQAPPPAASAAEQQQAAQKPSTKVPKGGTVAGSAKGAAGGAAIGAIAGDAGQGAAIGATVGAMSGRRRQKKAEKTAQQQAAQQQTQAQQQAQAKATAQQQASLDSFKRAFSACMDARGYSAR